MLLTDLSFCRSSSRKTASVSEWTERKKKKERNGEGKKRERVVLVIQRVVEKKKKRNQRCNRDCAYIYPLILKIVQDEPR